MLSLYIVLQNDPSKLDNYGKILFHGKGYDRWFDKSFTLCIGSNGRVSLFYIFTITNFVFAHKSYICNT